MEGHLLDGVTWVAAAAGSGFVSRCACGYETSPAPTRQAAIAAATSHVSMMFSVRKRRRWFGARDVVDIRDAQLIR